MFGITMLLMRISDWLAERQHKERMRCTICGQEFDTYQFLEEHKRTEHGATAA